jgi:hypothetical protein
MMMRSDSRREGGVMKRKNFIARFSIAGVILLSVAAWAGPDRKAVGNRHRGTLQNIVAGSLTMTTATTQPGVVSPQQTFAIAEDVRVSCRHDPCSLSDLTLGTGIKVRTEQRGNDTMITEIKEINNKKDKK